MAPVDLYDASSIHTDASIYRSPFIPSRQIHQGSVNTTPNNQIKSPTASTFTFRTHRERLDDPTASGLDLDDDARSSVASDIHDNGSQLGVGNGDDEEIQRMSYLGPKMRFHSRAPWEVDKEITEEDDQQSDHSNMFFGTSTKKKLALSSPRSNSIGRPSAESTRSQPKSKQSFETTSSSNFSYPKGALYTLAQESLSATSLGPPSSQKAFHGKFSSSLMRSDSPTGSFLPSPVSSARSSQNAPLNYHSPRQGSTDIPTSQHQATHDGDNFHPYANPDLVVSFEDQPHHSPFEESVAHSGSVSTVTDSIIPIPLSRTETNSTLSPSASTANTPIVNVKEKPSLVQGKGVPLPVRNNGPEAYLHLKEDRSTLRQSRFDNIPGWIDRTTNPGFSLISLEEARAQRMRSNAGAAHRTPLLPASSADLPSGATFNYEDHSGSRSQRVRARSISAGATKAKTALHTLVGGGQPGNERREPEPIPMGSSTKTLKHRKSGFMRLFNTGRSQEKEDRLQLPPVPPIPDTQAEHEAPKATTHRVPVPELPLSIEASPTLEPPSTMTSSPTPKRLHPPLSINTRSPGYVHRARSTVEDNSLLETHAMTAALAPSLPWLVPSPPKSAPADVSDFPSLKLRPVSTLFSAQFEDHIMPSESRPSLETDVGTPSSLTKLHSPVTPGSAFRTDLSSSDKVPAFTTTASENQGSVISDLQDQISNSKLVWQRQVRELENQVRDLKLQINSLHQTEIDRGYCETCGRGQPPSGAISSLQDGKNLSVINRPRARTGTTSRFGSAV